MRLSKAGYYADFVIYPPLILAMALPALMPATLHSGLAWMVAFVLGLAAWTLIEYLIHRVVLHHFRFFCEMHDLHHAEPRGYIGTPTWLSLGILCFGVLVPLWWATGPQIAAGAGAGLVLGYLWYVGLHHVVHHWRLRHDSYLYRVKRRHAMHHHGHVPCNFGVTSSFWDRVFGTEHGMAKVRTR